MTIVADGPATLGDLRALSRLRFDASDFRELPMQVLLQTGSESPPELYVTEALKQALPNARVGVLEGQAHEGMTTAPEQYARAVAEFLDEVKPG
jgi:pimeloyl-ACP methyl ester carboxylesterase